MANLTDTGFQATNNRIDPRQLLQALIQASGGASNMMGQASSMNPAMFQLPEAMIKGANKALSALGEKYAMEAANTPGGLESLNKVITQNMQMGQQQLASSPTVGAANEANKRQSASMAEPTQPEAPAPAPQAPMPQAPNQPMAPNGGNDIINTLLMALGGGMVAAGGGNAAPIMSMASQRAELNATQPGRELDNQLKQQKLEGKEPLQQGERDKIGLNAMAELQKALAVKGYEGLPPEQADKFSLLLEGRDAIAEVDRLVGGGDIGGIAAAQKFTPDFFKSPAQRELQLALQTGVDIRTRLETGAALGKGELEREAKKLMPRVGEDRRTWRKRIGRSFDFFNRSIATIDPQGIHEQRAMGARQRYAQDDLRQQAAAELARRRGQNA